MKKRFEDPSDSPTKDKLLYSDKVYKNPISPRYLQNMHIESNGKDYTKQFTTSYKNNRVFYLIFYNNINAKFFLFN